MVTERTRLLRGSPRNLHLRTQFLEGTVRELQIKVESQEVRIQALQETVEWSDDPAVRRARRSNLVMTAGSIGWWGGALSVSESLKYGAAAYLTGNDLAAFGLAAWIIGCSIGAGQSERAIKHLAVRITQGRYQPNPTMN